MAVGEEIETPWLSQRLDDTQRNNLDARYGQLTLVWAEGSMIHARPYLRLGVWLCYVSVGAAVKVVLRDTTVPYERTAVVSGY